MYSPTIGDFALGGDIATYEFVKANNAILNINQTFLQHMEDLSSKCGYTDVSLVETLRRQQADHVLYDFGR